MVEKKEKQDKKRKKVPAYKKKLVEKIVGLIGKKRTFMLVSTKGLPSKQFQSIRKKLRGKAQIIVAKKSIILKAIDSCKKGTLNILKKLVDRDYALMFSDLEAFELGGILADEKSEAAAKIGDIIDKDIKVEAGPTELIPGPVISELGALKIPIQVEDGKITIKQNKIILKKGDKVTSEAASIMLKLDIKPMEVSFLPIGAYDSKEDKIYEEIKIDKKGVLEELKNLFAKAKEFALNIGYVTKETLSLLIGKAGQEEKIIAGLIKTEEPAKGESEEKKEEKAEEKPADEKEKEKQIEESKKKEENTDEEKEEVKKEKQDAQNKSEENKQ